MHRPQLYRLQYQKKLWGNLKKFGRKKMFSLKSMTKLEDLTVLFNMTIESHVLHLYCIEQHIQSYWKLTYRYIWKHCVMSYIVFAIFGFSNVYSNHPTGSCYSSFLPLSAKKRAFSYNGLPNNNRKMLIADSPPPQAQRRQVKIIWKNE